MRTPWKLLAQSLLPGLLLPRQGAAGIAAHGHRAYVGGLWDELGQLQLDMLRANGLRPHHRLLDIGCGALRLGVKAIAYLDRGGYAGIEKEERLVALGIERELGPALLEEKKPELVISSCFEFDKLSRPPDYAIAQSLFTHLAPDLIALCFERLRAHVAPGTLFFATFFEAEHGWRNPRRSHDWGYFAYRREEMIAFGTDHGFSATYVGDWGHPRGQVLVRYQPTP